jgi:predicted N-acyltransferase
LIDYAIANKLEKFEAGAQGEHKYLRGFEVVPIYSSHMFFNSQANLSIANYLQRECENTKLAIEEWNLKSPLKIFREEEGAKP